LLNNNNKKKKKKKAGIKGDENWLKLKAIIKMNDLLFRAPSFLE
jgi:hypothetical protein